uniref:Reverse transcriptase domain-containing protein n=1 Tax=Tanacetum cinerariifolium TaxID=118510 RepID=A0A6L2KPQ3_TANCI|nr:hypothetical protein [Tanacetum cinerariifolium]
MSIGRLCLGENNKGSVAKGIENKEQWEGPEFQDMTSSRKEREAKVFTFYRMEEDEINKAGLPPFICKMGKSKRNKKKALKSFHLSYSDMGPSLSNRKPLTHEEAAQEALLDKYKKILDGIVMDKIKLDGEIKKKEEEAITQVKGEALKEKEDPRAFVILIRLEAKIDLNALVDTGVTTIIAKFLILDMPIDRDVPILVGRGFLYTCGSIVNTRDMITSTFDGVSHQTFHAAKTSLNTKESDSDDEEDYGIQRSNFRAPIYGPKPAKYLNCKYLIDQTLELQEVLNPFRKNYVWKEAVGFLGSFPVPLQHMEWKPYYEGNLCKKEEGDG